jgi:carbon-monoxide dehydrogenase small subunit
MFAVQAEGSQVVTIEGIARQDMTLHPVQDAFRAEHGLQCGFCTPGFITTLVAFLAETPKPTDDQLRDALSGNLCRCTGYQGILAAGRRAASRMSGEDAGART